MEQAVITYLRLTEGEFGSELERAALAKLANDLERIIDEQQVGEFDGDEFGDDRCVFYMYGPDADQLFEAVNSVLKSNPLARGGFAIKRYGEASDPDVKETRVSF